MIEIKNKRMILFREDRLIGAAGDINTSKRKFVLDAVQGECDLSAMVAWIKIDPQFPGEAPYDQLLKKELVEDKIILTWNLTARNLKRGGEISAQIIFASAEYFLEDDFENILDSIPMVPSPVVGVSAPVWQTYPETFVIEDSIVETEHYKEVTKNVLVSAVASAVSSAEQAQTSAEEALASKEEARSLCADTENMRDVVKDYFDDIKKHLEDAQACVEATDENLEITRSHVDTAAHNASAAESSAADANSYMLSAEQSSSKAEKALSAIKKARDFRLIYTKTLSSEDTDCYGFEVTEDVEGSPFSLSEFTIYAYIPTMPNAGSAYLQIKLQPDNMLENGERKYGIAAQFAGISSTKEYYHRVECANRGRWRANLVRGSAWSQNGDSVYHNGGVCSSSRFADGKNATAIIICGASGINVPFPEGTMIEVWGVDAIEEAE